MHRRTWRENSPILRSLAIVASWEQSVIFGRGC